MLEGTIILLFLVPTYRTCTCTYSTINLLTGMYIQYIQAHTKGGEVYQNLSGEPSVMFTNPLQKFRTETFTDFYFQIPIIGFMGFKR